MSALHLVERPLLIFGDGVLLGAAIAVRYAQVGEQVAVVVALRPALGQLADLVGNDVVELCEDVLRPVVRSSRLELSPPPDAVRPTARRILDSAATDVVVIVVIIVVDLLLLRRLVSSRRSRLYDCADLLLRI